MVTDITREEKANGAHRPSGQLVTLKNLIDIVTARNSEIVFRRAIVDRALLNPSSQGYGASLAVWDHTVLPATRHKSTRPAYPQSDRPRFKPPLMYGDEISFNPGQLKVPKRMSGDATVLCLSKIFYFYWPNTTTTTTVATTTTSIKSV